MDMFRTLQRLMTPVLARIRRVCIGAIIRRVDDSGNLQRMQIETLAHSVYDNVEKFEQFGFTSNPPDGLDAIIVERCGKYIVVAIGDRKYRIKNLESGDTAIYDMRGQTIVLNKTGISLTDAYGNMIVTDSSGINTTDTNGNKITMAASGININGVLITQTGVMTTPSTVTTGGDVTTAAGNTLDTHTHGVTTAVATSSPAPTGSWPTTPPIP